MFCRRARVFCPPKTGEILNVSFPVARMWGGPHRTPKVRAGVVYSCRFFCGLGQRARPTGRGMSVYPCLSTQTKVTLNASSCVHWCGVAVP